MRIIMFNRMKNNNQNNKINNKNVQNKKLMIRRFRWNKKKMTNYRKIINNSKMKLILIR